MKSSYQDIWRDGKLVAKGKRDCVERYDLIRLALQKRIEPGFTVADIGGWDGYFGIRLTEDMDANATNIDQRVKQLPIRHRVMNVNADTVEDVGYHDVILVLSVLHHMDDWLEVYNVLRSLCRLLIIELAHPDEAETAKVARADVNTSPSYYHVMNDGLLLGTTPGPNGVDRPLLLIRNAAWGRVEDGSGRCGKILAVTDMSPLGYQPYPGSLNVRIGREACDWIAAHDHLTIPSSRSDDRYVPVVVNDCECYASFQRDKDVVELIASHRLRDELNLSNDDTVEIRPRSRRSAS